MPLVPSPTFTEQPRKMFEISTPCSGGLNLHDLPFKQEVDQSPTTLNMLYRMVYLVSVTDKLIKQHLKIQYTQ